MKQHTNSDLYLSKIYKSTNTARTVPKQLTHVCVKAMLRDHQRQYGDHPTILSVTWQCVYSCLSTVLFYQTQGQGAWVRVSRWGASSHQSHLWSCVENLGEGDQVDGQGKCTPSSYICTTNLMCSFLNVITQTCVLHARCRIQTDSSGELVCSLQAWSLMGSVSPSHSSWK